LNGKRKKEPNTKNENEKKPKEEKA